MNLNTEQYFSVVPEADIPRSIFDRSFSYKTTMNVNQFYPIFIDEALPGDTFKLDFQCFGRIINPLVAPIIDELYFETLWFKCPNRLLWSNWKRFCGEQDNPDDSTDFIIPTINSGKGFEVGSIADYFGIPVGVPNLDVNSLPFRMYNLTYNQWLRDENLINSVTVEQGDSDNADNYKLLNSAKMHDYFTSALPFAQKGDPVLLPLGGEAPVSVFGNGNSLCLQTDNGAWNLGIGNNTNGLNIALFSETGGARSPIGSPFPTATDNFTNQVGTIGLSTNASFSGIAGTADLTGATSISVNDFRFAVQLQKKRERDARGGTRYIEFIKSHFNVTSPDARQQRVEFLGSTRKMIDINTVVQTSSTDATSPQGNLSAYGVIGHHESGFSTSFTEHSYVMGLCRIRHNPLYQQGLNRMWTRSTLLDFYLPVFSHLGEQPIRNDEIFAQGNDVKDESGRVVDTKTFGFQEAWAPYRYKPSMITGMLRSGVDQSLDLWHLAQDFDTLPLLNQSFIEENIPIDRVLSVGTSATTPAFLFDFRFNYECARPMPVRSVPGLVDHF